MSDAKDALALTEEVYAAVAPLLAGKGSHLQGAVMLDLLARWLAGHIDTDSKKATIRLREKMMTHVARAALAMAEVYDEERGSPARNTRH